MPENKVEYQLDKSAQEMLDKHTAWWRREALLVSRTPASPLGDLWLPLSDGTVAQHDMEVTPDMLDLDRLAGEPEASGPLEFEGDVVRTRAAYARVPWVEAILGCPIHATIQGGSMRTGHIVSDWSEWTGPGNWQSSPWLDKLVTLTEMLAERSNGRYAVSHTLMRGPVDLAEAVLGPELLALSIFDHPHRLKAFLGEVTAVFLGVLHAQTERIPRIQGGLVNPFGVWCPGTMVRTQCDASAILSPRQYGDWFLPYDADISRAVDCSVIHLHSGSLHTIPVLMEVEHPQAIQVSLDGPPAAPPLPELLPDFQRVLAGKPLIVDGDMTEAELQMLLDELPHEGLYIRGRMIEE